jgi:thiol-disulfide isomerase/thioredoxin
MKPFWNSPKFVFPLVWIITITLFAWGFGTRFLDLRSALQKANLLAPITSEELKTRLIKPNTKIHLVHVWATWCEPCVREMPIFKQLQQEYSRDEVELYLISADEIAERPTVEKFLKAQGIVFQTYHLNEDPERFMKALHPSWSGALPITLLFKPGGAMHSMTLGESTLEQLKIKIESGLRP